MENIKQEYKFIRVWQETHGLLLEESEKTGVPFTILLHRIVKQALRTPIPKTELNPICKEARQDMTW